MSEDYFCAFSLCAEARYYYIDGGGVFHYPKYCKHHLNRFDRLTEYVKKRLYRRT